MKKNLSLRLLCAALTLSLLPSAALAATPRPRQVVVSPQSLSVDGVERSAQKYNIDGSNYFKLRDLAYLLNGTESQFAVGWDGATSTVSITTGSAYAPNGGELQTGTDRSASARPSAQTILVNGARRDDLYVYNIGDENYFKLRDLGTALGFDVDFDAGTNTAVVESKGYHKPAAPEQPEPVKQPEPAEQPKPTEQPEPAEQPKPTEQPKPAEQPEPTEQPKPAEQPEPTEQPKPAEQPEPEVTAEMQLTVAGKVYSLGMTAEALTALAGQPKETLSATGGYVWYVFGTDSYLDFLLAGVYGGKVVTLASGGKAFSYLGSSAGAKNVSAANSFATLYTDKNDGGILHAVMLRDRSALPDGHASTAEALRGESVVNFHMTNAFRVYHGLTPYRWSEAAAEASRLHSQDMADQNYFDHNSLDGRSPWARMEAQGIRWSDAAENISAGRSNGVDSYDGWVNSSGHRKNMLGGCENLGVGAGYSAASTYGWYMTQDFFTARTW